MLKKTVINRLFLSSYVTGPYWHISLNGLMTCKKGIGLNFFFRGLLTLVLENKELIESVFCSFLWEKGIINAVDNLHKYIKG